MTAPPVSAGWPLDRLVSALARAGWDDLTGRVAGGVRATLRALADLLPHGSALGEVTANQIADASGLCNSWTRRCLSVLEDMGIITWTRGGITDGRPIPSIIKVSKQAVADLANRARRSLPPRLEERATATARRVRDTLRTRSTMHRRPRRPARTKHVATTALLSKTLPPRGEEPKASGPRSEQPPPPRGTRLAAFRAALARQHQDTA